jgi:hypothetical protein
MKLDWRRWVVTVAVGGVTLGCATGPGKVTSGAYESRYEGLRVVGESDGAAASAGLMPSGWKLDNFYGSPVPDEPKGSGDYVSTYRLDGDGNGSYESRIDRASYELRFVSLNDDAVAWLRVVPVSRGDAEMALPVLVEHYVDSLSGGRFDAVWVDKEGATVHEQRYTAALLDSQECELAGVACRLATIDVADVDQIKLSPEKRVRKLQVLFAKSPFVLTVRGKIFSTYLVAGYSNLPGRFDNELADFQGLLRRVVIHDQSGFSVKSAPVATEKPAATTDGPPDLDAE